MNSLRHPIREPAPPGPPVLAWLVMLCAGAFVLRLFAAPVPPGQPPPGALSLAALESGEWWAVLTHIFTHADVWHLVSNTVLLVLAGRAVERNAGPRHLFYIFLASAWAGAALCLILRPEQAIIGASGAVWGIIGAFAALHPEYDLTRPLRRMVPLPPLKAKRLFPAFLIVHCGLEIAVRSAPGFAWMGVERVAHLVHAGGLLAGWLYGRRLASDASRHDEWTDFFPQGLRPRRGGGLAGGLVGGLGGGLAQHGGDHRLFGGGIGNGEAQRRTQPVGEAGFGRQPLRQLQAQPFAHLCRVPQHAVQRLNQGEESPDLGPPRA